MSNAGLWAILPGLVLIAGRPATGAAGTPPTIFWASSPTLPDETVVLHGANFGPQPSVTLRVLGSTTTTPLTPEYVNTSAMAVVIPPSTPLGAYALAVNGVTVHLNTPEVWWVQGDAGETATPGGWVRVFGKALQLATAPLADRLRAIDRSLRSAADARDIATLRSLLAERATVEAGLRESTATLQLRLTPVAGEMVGNRDGTSAPTPIVLPCVAVNSSAWDGWFELPPTVAIGEYHVDVSNGIGGDEAPWVPLDAFIDPLTPHMTTLRVTAPRVYPSQTFRVVDYNLTFNDTYWSGLPYNRSASGTGVHWDIPLARALDAARKAGGGTVLLPPGMLYLTESIKVPNNVLLKGTATDLTSIQFAEVWDRGLLPKCFDDPTQAPVYICSDVPGDNNTAASLPSVRWGVEDLTIYVTSLHGDVIQVHNKTDGFSLKRVRARVTSFLYQGNFPQGHENDVVNGSKVLRPLNITDYYMKFQTGAFLVLHGRNWEVTDNDVMCDGTAINSFVWDANHQRHSTQWGLLQRNTFHYGVSCHPMDAWQQVISEDNLCHGTALLSGGMALGTSAGGFAQHYYSHRNRLESEWSADREVITFDDAGGSYLGPISVDGTAVTTKFSTKAAASDRMPFGWEGGSIAIINGTGEGQLRRIVKAPIFDVPVSDNRSGWVIDRPFDVTPGPESFAQIYDYRGRVLWYSNEWSDVGTFQTYGTSTDVVFASNVWTRGSKITIEGQWRGWTPTGPGGQLGGAFGIGVNPTFRSIVVDNTVAEGNSVALYWDGLWRQGVLDLEAGGGEAGGKYGLAVSPVLSWGTIFKRNTVRNGGGVRVGPGQHSAVCEHNTVQQSQFGIVVNAPHSVTPLVFRKNTAETVTIDQCNVSAVYGGRGTGACWNTPNIGPG